MRGMCVCVCMDDAEAKSVWEGDRSKELSM